MVYINKCIMENSSSLTEKLKGTIYKVIVPIRSIEVDGKEFTLYKEDDSNGIKTLDVFSPSRNGGVA